MKLIPLLLCATMACAAPQTEPIATLATLAPLAPLAPIAPIAPIATLAPAAAPQTRSAPPAANRMQADHAPTPFSAAEIAAACPPGSSRNMSQTALNASGSTAMLFHENDGTTVTIEAIAYGPDGTELGRETAPPVTWTDLQSHASFPQEFTTITRETVTVEAGQFDCWIYTVDFPGPSLQVFSFALDLPGPPVLLSATEDGVEVMRLELTDYAPR